MEHINDIELIELVAQRLDAGRKNAILAHLEGCAHCCEKLAQVRNTWDLLGQWDVQPPRSLDTERICALAAEAAEHEAAGKTIRFPAAGILLRVAASVALASLIGYTAGRWSVGPAPASASGQSPSYVSALDLEVGESLSTLVLDDTPDVGEGR